MKATETTPQPGEQIVQIPLGSLRFFPNHPFTVRGGESLNKLTDSIEEYGVVTPIIVRPKEGAYEIVSGHRRACACKALMRKTIPAVVRELDDEDATLLMVDSNLHREEILPSERAFSYAMKMEALRRKAGRPSVENASRLGTDLVRTDAKVAHEFGTSRNQVQRYIRLTRLIPDLLEMVDEKKIALTPAVELSYLSPDEQEILVDALERAQCSPSLSQAQRMRGFSQEQRLNADIMDAILSEDKMHSQDKITFDRATLAEYFPEDYTNEQMTETIKKLLSGWHKRRERAMER